MIPIPSGVRVWIATGHTDMRRGMNGLALQVQQALQRDPHAGDLFAFRGRRGNLIKILWHDGLGMSLYAKRLERGKFIWPSPADGEALIAHLRLAIEKMRRELYGQRAERKARLLDQMELELEELEAAAAEDEFAAGKAAVTSDNTTAVRGFTRRKPSRKPFPAHLPRERVIVPGPTACACCGSTRLAKLGEDVTETLEVVPRQWKVVQYVREKFTSRACDQQIASVSWRWQQET
jgi:transposase